MSPRIYPVAAALALLATSFVVIPAEAGAQQGEPVPSAAPTTGDEAIEALGAGLPQAASDAGLSPAELTDRFTTDPSLQATSDGILTDDDPAPPAPPQARTGETDSAAFVPGSTFNLSSKPGANRTIYLDFLGGTVTDTYWNATYTGGAPIVVPPWDIDGNSATLSIAEQKIIQTAWHVVAEDFAPWDVNVTTANPGLAALERTNAADQVFGQRVMYSNSNHGMCTGCAGVAIIGAFDATGSYLGPAWAFTDTLYGEPKYYGDVSSHELGHTFTLGHDGTSGAAYYAGHDDWSPIMGSTAWRPIVQWSKGEYDDANRQEDDLSLIAANGVDLKPDDHGDTLATGTPITPATPVKGLINTSADIDQFTFDGSGPFTASLSLWDEHPNLDARLRLLNSAGSQVAASDPQKLGAPSLSVPSLAGGRYSIEVDGVGWGDPLGTGYTDYGSLGAYALSTSFNQAPIANGTITPTTVQYQGTLSYNASLSSDPDGTITAYNWNFGDGTTSTSASGTKAYSAPGSYTATLKVTDNKGATGTKTFAVTVNEPEAVDDTAATTEHGIVSVFVLANDIPSPAPSATIAAITQPAKGSASIFSMPSKGIRFDAGTDFDGLDTGETEDATFTYTRQQDGYTDTATVTVTVSGENDAPVAADSSKTTDEDTALTFAAPMSDVDVEPLTITKTTQPSAGSVTISGTNLVFNPGNDFQALRAGQTSQVTFTYTASDGDLTATGTITVTVTGLNDSPVAVNDTAATPQGTSASLDPTTNDIDPEGDSLGVASVSAPNAGSATRVSPHEVRFTPSPADNALDDGESANRTFDYVVTDGAASDTGTVTVTVTGVNDRPVAANGSKTTDEDTVLTFAAPMSDVDVEPLTITKTTQPSAGSVTISGTNLVFNPGNAFQALGGGQTQQVSFTYTATDGDLTDTGTITITVTGVNDAPVAANDSYSAVAGQGLTFDPVTGHGADTDVDTAVSTLTVPALPSGGTGTISRVGATGFTYNPPPAANLLRIGTSLIDTFTYTVSDGHLTDTATITFTVTRELPAECTSAPPHGFTDVTAGDWYDGPVAWVKAMGITSGTTPTLYGPHTRTTRAQMATFLWGLRGRPTGNANPGFSDVPSDAYYAEAVAYLVGSGVTSGTSATRFSPNAPVTRAQMATFLWALAGQPATAASNPFNDVPAGKYYTVPATWAAEVGITTGTSPGVFSPDSAVTRAQMATFLRHYVCTVGYA